MIWEMKDEEKMVPSLTMCAKDVGQYRKIGFLSPEE